MQRMLSFPCNRLSGSRCSAAERLAQLDTGAGLDSCFYRTDDRAQQALRTDRQAMDSSPQTQCLHTSQGSQGTGFPELQAWPTGRGLPPLSCTCSTQHENLYVNVETLQTVCAAIQDHQPGECLGVSRQTGRVPSVICSAQLPLPSSGKSR